MERLHLALRVTREILVIIILLLALMAGLRFAWILSELSQELSNIFPTPTPTPTEPIGE
jgi:hypothetical protein